MIALSLAKGRQGSTLLICQVPEPAFLTTPQALMVNSPVRVSLCTAPRKVNDEPSSAFKSKRTSPSA